MAGLALFAFVADQRDRQAASPATVETVTVGQRSYSYPVAVTVRLTMPTPARLVSSRAGVVTSIHIAAGQTPRNGAVAFSVADRSVYLHVGAVPFYRPIGTATRGKDVDELRKFLAARGLLVKSKGGTSVDVALREAICDFNRDVGVACSDAFDPSHVVFVPSSASVIGEVDLVLGQRLENGTVVGEAEGVPTAVRFVPQDERATLASLTGHELELSTGSAGLGLSGIDPSGSELAAIGGFVSDNVATGSMTAATSKSIVEAHGAILKLRHPIHAGVVPASALVAADDGTSCVIQARSGTSSSTPRLSDLAAVVIRVPAAAPGEIGVVMVDADLIGTTILRDPSTIPRSRDTPCG